MKSYKTVINEIQSCYSSSFRLKKIVEELDTADVLEAYQEAEVIHAIFLAKFDEMDFWEALNKIRGL